jgi:hypothetical protein
MKTKPTAPPLRVAHSGYANAPFIIYAGDRAPNFKAPFPLSGCHAIAEVFHDEGPDHEEQSANAYAMAAASLMLDALESVRDAFAGLGTQGQKIAAWDKLTKAMAIAQPNEGTAQNANQS